MRVRMLKAVLIPMLALVTALATWRVARAFTLFYTWATPSATYYYAASLPVAFQGPTDRGANVWTDVPTSSWTFVKFVNSSNRVEWAPYDGPGRVIAYTDLWTSGVPPYIVQFIIRYDSAENWYTGTGTPGSTQYDAQSIAAHEFGHALGLGHTQLTHCPGGAQNATMCGGAFIGVTWQRSLETDDKNGVTFAYRMQK